MYQMPIPIRAPMPIQMTMPSMPPQMYVQYPPPYIHPNQYPYNSGGPMKQMPMNLNQYHMNNSIPQHQQIPLPPQPHQLPNINISNQYKIGPNVQPREYILEKQPEVLYKNQQTSSAQNNNSYPAYSSNYTNINNQNYNQNIDKSR
jgi:hypothetical protein